MPFNNITICKYNGSLSVVCRNKEEKPHPPENVYYNTAPSPPVCGLHQRATPAGQEDDEPRYVTVDDVTTKPEDAAPAAVYAVPNRGRSRRPSSGNDVTLVDNEVYTERHGAGDTDEEDDVTIVDNTVYS